MAERSDDTAELVFIAGLAIAAYFVARTLTGSTSSSTGGGTAAPTGTSTGWWSSTTPWAAPSPPSSTTAPAGAVSGPWSLSSDGLAFIQRREGPAQLAPYHDLGSAQAIGFGHNFAAGSAVPSSITADQAETFLETDMEVFASYVSGVVTIALTQYEFDALCSLCMRIGTGAFGRSQLLADLNASNFTAVANDWLGFTNAGGKFVQGVLNRSKLELALFQNGTYA